MSGGAISSTRSRAVAALFAAVIAASLPACAGSPDKDRVDDDTSADSATAPCPTGSVAVADFCIDAWETSVHGEAGNVDQGVDFPDGTTTATSEATSGVSPTEHISWYQAYAVCAVDGRHLCSVDEWQTACGTATWPWGDSPDALDVCAVAFHVTTTGCHASSSMLGARHAPFSRLGSATAGVPKALSVPTKLV